MEGTEDLKGARGLVLASEPRLAQLVTALRRSGAWALGAEESRAAQRATADLGTLEFLLIVGDAAVLETGATVLDAAVRRGDPVMGVVVTPPKPGADLGHLHGLPVYAFYEDSVTTLELIAALSLAVGYIRRLARAHVSTPPPTFESPLDPRRAAALVQELLDALSGGSAHRRRVLACLVVGMTNKEMIDVLALDTENQVKKAVRGVLQSIGVTTRTAIVRAYFERIGALDAMLQHTRR